MQFEKALGLLSPQTVNLHGFTGSTSPAKLTASDIMTALSLTSSQAPLGVDLLLLKFVDGKQNRAKTVETIMQFSRQHAPAGLRKAAGEKFERCSKLLAQFALDDYCRSAASLSQCPLCEGAGKIFHAEEGPEGRGFSRCAYCAGKGVVSARCRCGGRGEIQDRKRSRERGVAVFKPCERCGGRGYTLVTAAMVYRALLTILPELHIRTWNRNWKDFYTLLVSRCYSEEERAKQVFDKITRDAHRRSIPDDIA